MMRRWKGRIQSLGKLMHLQHLAAISLLQASHDVHFQTDLSVIGCARINQTNQLERREI